MRNNEPLLPTPRTSDTNGPGRHGTGGPDLRTVISDLAPDAERESRQWARLSTPGQKKRGGGIK